MHVAITEREFWLLCKTLLEPGMVDGRDHFVDIARAPVRNHDLLELTD